MEPSAGNIFPAQNYIRRYYVECGGLFDILKDHDLFNDDDHLAVLYWKIAGKTQTVISDTNGIYKQSSTKYWVLMCLIHDWL